MKAFALLVIALMVCGTSFAPATAFGSEADSYTAPRGPGGKPDLNGVWQVLNRANYNVEAHAARAALALVDGDLGPVPAPPIVALGSIGSVPTKRTGSNSTPR